MIQMIYTRALTLAATIGFSGYLLKSYKNRKQENEKNILLTHTQNHRTKNFYFPLNPYKFPKINNNLHNSIQDKWRSNIFKINADEQNQDNFDQDQFEQDESSEEESGQDENFEDEFDQDESFEEESDEAEQVVGVNQAPQTQWEFLEMVIQSGGLNPGLLEIARFLLRLRQFLHTIAYGEDLMRRSLHEKEHENPKIYGLQKAKRALDLIQINRNLVEGEVVKAINNLRTVCITRNQEYYVALQKDINNLKQNLDILRDQAMKSVERYEAVYDECGIELNDEDEDEDDANDANDAAAVNPNIPLSRSAHPEHAYSNVIQYTGFSMEYTRGNRVPILSQEVLTRENIGEIEHRHWELISIVPDVPEALQATTNVCENNEFDVVRVGGGDLFPGPVAGNNDVEQPVCEVCQNAPFWPLFYRYVKFLIDMHDVVTVYSGVLYRPNPVRGIHTYEQNYADLTPDDRPTHFFKCVFVDYGNGTCRFESYLVPNKCMKDEKPKLKDYLTQKDRIERSTTYVINIDQTVKDDFPHKFFDYI